MVFSGRLCQQVTIYRRVGESCGGTQGESYLPLRVTGAAVRDESSREWDEREAAEIEHVLTFTLRAQAIPTDGLIGFRGGLYRIRRIDSGDFRGRRIRVTAYRVTPRATLSQGEVREPGEIRI